MIDPQNQANKYIKNMGKDQPEGNHLIIRHRTDQGFRLKSNETPRVSHLIRKMGPIGKCGFQFGPLFRAHFIITSRKIGTVPLNSHRRQEHSLQRKIQIFHDYHSPESALFSRNLREGMT